MIELPVRKFLASLPKNKPIYYRANPGNAGDALIASGAYKLFEQAGLDISLIEPQSFDATNKTVIYAGGGNLVGIYPEARDFFFKFHRHAKHMILLPHTVTKNEDLLSQLGSNVTIFARERVSYEHVKLYAKNANVFLDHDLAFNLDVREMLATPLIWLPTAVLKKIYYKATRSERSFGIPQPKIMYQNSLFEIRTSLRRGYNQGNFFRVDVEATREELPPNNADLSKIYEHGTRNKSLVNYTTTRLMRYINRFSAVRTDRLHICIAAALLNKEVEFYPNSYFKCKAVFEYSLKDQYPNVCWKG